MSKFYTGRPGLARSHYAPALNRNGASRALVVRRPPFCPVHRFIVGETRKYSPFRAQVARSSDENAVLLFIVSLLLFQLFFGDNCWKQARKGDVKREVTFDFSFLF